MVTMRLKEKVVMVIKQLFARTLASIFRLPVLCFYFSTKNKVML